MPIFSNQLTGSHNYFADNTVTLYPCDQCGEDKDTRTIREDGVAWELCEDCRAEKFDAVFGEEALAFEKRREVAA
jgi:hypothetical protein